MSFHSIKLSSVNHHWYFPNMTFFYKVTLRKFIKLNGVFLHQQSEPFSCFRSLDIQRSFELLAYCHIIQKKWQCVSFKKFLLHLRFCPDLFIAVIWKRKIRQGLRCSNLKFPFIHSNKGQQQIKRQDFMFSDWLR